MCPSPHVSGPVDIDTNATDEEVLRFLEGRKVGDPIPANVITEVNPFAIEPWDLTENIWYMHNYEGSKSPEEDVIKVTSLGYWMYTDDHRIYTNDCTFGRKTTLEFYEGKSPSGNRTGWMMHQYQTEHRTLNGANRAKEYSSFCRVFLQTDGGGDSSGDYVEQLLLKFLEPEESNKSSQESNKSSQGCAKGSQEQAEVSSRSPKEHVHDNSGEDIACEFLTEEYLELNDLYSPGTSSDSSHNSSRMSVSSDEYLDADALLRDIEKDCGQRVEEEHTDCKFSISASVKSDQVVIRHPSSGSVHRNGNVTVKDSTISSSLFQNKLTSSQELSLSTDEMQHKRRASTAGMSQSIQEDRTAYSSEAARTPLGNGFKSVAKIARVGRKYCCFATF